MCVYAWLSSILPGLLLLFVWVMNISYPSLRWHQTLIVRSTLFLNKWLHKQRVKKVGSRQEDCTLAVVEFY